MGGLQHQGRMLVRGSTEAGGAGPGHPGCGGGDLDDSLLYFLHQAPPPPPTSAILRNIQLHIERNKTHCGISIVKRISCSTCASHFSPSTPKMLLPKKKNSFLSTQKAKRCRLCQMCLFPGKRNKNEKFNTVLGNKNKN